MRTGMTHTKVAFVSARPAKVRTRPCRNEIRTAITRGRTERERCSWIVRSSSSVDNSSKSQDTETETTTTTGNTFLSEMSSFLEEDLKHLFDEKGIDKSIYADDVAFEDPITKYSSISGYLYNIQMLRYLFTPEFFLHDIYEVNESTLETRWTMNMKLRVLPWQPDLTFTGTSQYEFDLKTKKVVRHSDTWDSIDDQEYFSMEGLRDLVKQASNLQQTPELETPKYTTLKRLADYEVRRYESYLVCETGTSSKDVTTGDGFNTLAGFIFGGNEREEKMNMTTPVYTTSAKEEEPGNTKMQFVIEKSKYEKPSDVPKASASTARVTVKEEEGSICAVCTVGGVPLQSDVNEAEAKLRKALARDGIEAEDGFELARYNEPFVLPPFRRNEVLIKVKNFSM